MHATLPLLEVTDFPDIYRDAANTLQVNLGYRCNQRCLHCHVNASPDRTEMMGEENLRLIIPVMKARGMTNAAAQMAVAQAFAIAGEKAMTEHFNTGYKYEVLPELCKIIWKIMLKVIMKQWKQHWNGETKNEIEN